MMPTKRSDHRAADFGETQHGGLVGFPKEATLDSSAWAASAGGADATPSSGYTKEKLAAARRAVREFNRWWEENDSAVRFASRRLLGLAKSGTRVSATMFIIEIREHELLDNHGEFTRVCNSWAPLIARRLAAENPVIAEHIVINHSIFDVVGGW